MATSNPTPDAAVPAIVEATTASVQDEGKKVYVGNIKKGITEEELKAIFQGHGTVVHAKPSKKRTFGRSAPPHYGFVTFSTVEEASLAISQFNNKEVDGKALKVEIAKPSPTTPRGNIAKEAAEAAGGPEPATAEGTGRRGGRGRRGRGRGRARGGRRAAPADGEADGAELGADQEQGEAHLNGDASDGAAGEASAKRGRGRGRGRGRLTRRGPPEGEPSKTLLFVANLPFTMDNDGLKALFDGYKLVNAHVVVRKRGPVTGRSKGFGFVELEDEQEQKKVLEAFNAKEVDGRVLQVKVAIEPTESQEPTETVAPTQESTETPTAPAA